jgi:hypothetical protein
LQTLLSADTKVSIDNYAKGGSSLYFSYKNFLVTQHRYDLVLFLATEPHRYPISFETQAAIGKKFYITGIPHIDQLKLSLKLTSGEIEFLDSLKGWFSASSQPYNDDMADIILDKVEYLHKNVIIYPCFTQSFKKERYKKYNLDPYLHPLHCFWHRQLELFDIDHVNFSAQEKKTLACHLTPEFNQYFAKVLYSKITTDKYDHSGFFDITIKEPKTHYYSNWD